MTNDTDSARSTRRSFLKRGALLAVPLAAAAPAAVIADDSLRARLARLEDEAAIREVHQSWMRRVSVIARANAGDATAPLLADVEGSAFNQAVRSIAPDHSGESDAIEVALDGKSATGRFQCAVEIETAILDDCTLARMAHAQGGGFIRRTERRALTVEYVKAGAAWSIASVQFV